MMNDSVQGDSAFFTERLYPLQDQVLSVIAEARTGFYLTGGTALSRGYLNHRYSDDLDLFTNMAPEFSRWAEQMIAALSADARWRTNVVLRHDYTVRLFVEQGDLALKIECINDVPSRVGELRQHEVLGLLDSPENIFANKLTALVGRDEAKDVADVWALSYRMGLSIQAAIEGAGSKAAGIYAATIASRLFQVTRDDWATIRWISPPEPEQYLREVKQLAERLLIVD